MLTPDFVENTRSHTLADIAYPQGFEMMPTAIVQCKAWGDSYVGVKPIRELLGVMVHENVPRAFFMASGKYSEEAKAFAEPNRTESR